MRTFTIRELPDHAGELRQEAEQGRPALVTHHGKPLFVCVPFTDALLETGVHIALAVKLFQNGDLSSARAAKLAGMSLSQFLAHLSAQGIAVVDYHPDELAQELASFEVRTGR